MALGRSLLVVSDFDGTLARLVSDPWAASIIPTAQRALRRLASADDIAIALLSGRTVTDLAGRARVGGVRYLGDHGAEWATAARPFQARALRVEREPATALEAAMAERLRREVPRVIDEPWLVVEAKGPALTFHFRAAPNVDAARARVLAAADALDPDGVLVRSGGRRSVELRPADASDKGLALARLIESQRPGVVVMLGDDHTDVLAFTALRAARDAGRVDGFAIAVAGHPDVRPRVVEQADEVLGSPREAARFLSLLASGLAPPPRGGPGQRHGPSRRPPAA